MGGKEKGNSLGLEKAKWGHQLSSTRGDNPTWPQHLPHWIGSRKKLHSIFGVIFFFSLLFFGFFRQIIPTTGVQNYVLDDYFNWKTMPLKKKNYVDMVRRDKLVVWGKGYWYLDQRCSRMVSFFPKRSMIGIISAFMGST